MSKVFIGNIKGKTGDSGYTPQKGVDYFDGQNGKDGTSVTVASVSESTADGGSNVVNFSDGKSITIKNGSKGSKGDSGYTPQKNVDYFDGKDGTNGVSCAHNWNGTTLTITSASGTSSANLKGDKGDKGDTGPAYTLNDTDKNAIASAVRATTTTADISGAADTNYTTLKARAESLNSAETIPSLNGAIAWTYE